MLKQTNVTGRETQARKAGTKKEREHDGRLLTLALVKSAQRTNDIAEEVLTWMQYEGIIRAQVGTR